MISQIKQKGFTIVELLIVIVVIGILAAISIVAYNGVTQKARDDQRLSDSRNIINAAASYQAEYGSWPTIAQVQGSADVTGMSGTRFQSIKLSGTTTTRLGTATPSGTSKDVYLYRFCTDAARSSGSTALSTATGIEVIYHKEDGATNVPIVAGKCSA